MHSSIQSTQRKYFIQGMNMFQNKGAQLLNRHGERYMAKYDPKLIERANYQKLVLGISKEGYEGNGPLSWFVGASCARNVPLAMRHNASVTVPFIPYDVMNFPTKKV